MTYSYATKVWVKAHLDRCIFGRETIAWAAKIPPRTIASWMRGPEQYRPKHSAQCNEYERAMVVVLYRQAPYLATDIARHFKLSIRTVIDFDLQVRQKLCDTDLKARTLDALTVLEPAIARHLSKYDIQRYIKDRMLWPCPYQVYFQTWEMLDERFAYLMREELMNRSQSELMKIRNMIMAIGGDLDPAEELAEAAKYARRPLGKPLRMYGPHKNRWGKVSGDQVDRDPMVTAKRQTPFIEYIDCLDPDKMCRVTTFLMGDCKPFEFDWDKSDLSA